MADLSERTILFKLPISLTLQHTHKRVAGYVTVYGVELIGDDFGCGSFCIRV